jgi:hypothetical protein
LIRQSCTGAPAEDNQDGCGSEDQRCRDGEGSEEATANGTRIEPKGEADEKEEEASA